MLGTWKEVREEAKRLSRQLRRNQTLAEKIFWGAVRNKQFMGLKFHRQHPIFHEDSGSPRFFVADFFCPEARLVVELDGASHQSRQEYDDERSEIIRARNVRIRRYRNEDVEQRLSEVLADLEKFIRANSTPNPLLFVEREGGGSHGG